MFLLYLISERGKQNVVLFAVDPLCDAEGAETLQGRQRAGVQRLCQAEGQGVCEEVYGQIRPRVPQAPG